MVEMYEFQIIESRSDQDQALEEDEDEALNGLTGHSLTTDDTPFVSKGDFHSRILWVHIHKSLTGKTTGNTHVMKFANVNNNTDGEVTKITPIKTGGNTACYRWGDSHVLIVQG
jgi:hypothetical protein